MRPRQIPLLRSSHLPRLRRGLRALAIEDAPQHGDEDEDEDDEDARTPSAAAPEEPDMKRGRIAVADPIPRCYSTAGMLSVHYLIYLLKTTEPVSLSEPQLKSRLCGSRSRHIPKPPLLEILQALTGSAPRTR